MIEMVINIPPPEDEWVRNYKSGNWERFGLLLEDTVTTESPEKWTIAKLEKEACLFTDNIKKILDITHPKFKCKPRLPNTTWFTPEVSKAKRLTKRAYNRWRSNKDPLRFHTYVEHRKQYRKKLNKANRTNWKEFVERHVDFEKVAKFRHVLDKKSQNALGMVTDRNGKPARDVKHTLDILLQEHFPDCKNITNGKNYGTPRIRECEPSDGNTPFITVEKVEAAIKTFGSHKAAGLDEVKPIVLNHLRSKAIKRLTTIYQSSVMLGYTPTCWRESRVIFIPKPNKDDYGKPRSFRPISLMSFILKTLERLVLWHLQDTTFEHHPLNSNQHAFRRGRSTESALSNFTEYIELSIKKKQYTLAIFLDIQGAFDNLTTEAMISGLKAKGVEDQIINLIHVHIHHDTWSAYFCG